jgi:hypothetical protein
VRKNSVNHPHPFPPPSRGREFLFEFPCISPLLLAGEGRERENISIFSHLPPSRRREFLFYFNMFPLSLRGRGEGEGELFGFFHTFPHRRGGGTLSEGGDDLRIVMQKNSCRALLPICFSQAPSM